MTVRAKQHGNIEFMAAEQQSKGRINLNQNKLHQLLHGKDNSNMIDEFGDDDNNFPYGVGAIGNVARAPGEG